MVWKVENKQGSENEKVMWDIVPYTRGKVLELGCGHNKTFPHFTGVDNQSHAELFGWAIKADIVASCEDLSLFASQQWDAVFSSHLLEHIEDHKAALKEWWRVIKPGGYLVLYLPHKDFYPNIGVEGANPDHKHDFLPQDIVDVMPRGWDLVENQERNGGEEYSFLQVYKKLKSDKRIESWKNPKPTKTAAVVRYGAFGDLMQASSVLAGLKDQGYHTTLYSSPPGLDVILHDPHIDRFYVQDKDQVPNGNLGDFWKNEKKKYDKFINLSESVEGTLLAMPDRINHTWPHEVRQKYLNGNYLQFQHELAGIPHKPQVRFYATEEEKAWAKKERSKMGQYIILWSLSGSSKHKAWPYVDHIIASQLIQYPECTIVLTGGAECVVLESGWENEKRVVRTSGKWGIRNTLSFLSQCDLIIGPETGVLNAACQMDVPKVVFLSHSSHENLTRDWINTAPLFSKKTACYPCHMMHYTWDYCPRYSDDSCEECTTNEKLHKVRTCKEHSGAAKCQQDISAQDAWDVIQPVIENTYWKAA